MTIVILFQASGFRNFNFLVLTDFVVMVIAPAPEGRNVYSNAGELSF